MFVQERILRWLTIDGHFLYLVSTFAEVEDDFLRSLQKETDTGFSFHRLLFLLRDGEGETIFQFLDFLFAELGKLQGDTLFV